VKTLVLTVTGLADQAVILPLVLSVAVMLLAMGERRAATWWSMAIAVALGGTFVAKLLFIPCGPHFGLPVRSPSGHSAAAVSVYGGLFVLAARLGLSRLVTVVLGLAVVGLAAAVGLSRVALHAHNFPEVLVGSMIGLAAPLILSLVRPLYVTGTLVRLRWLTAVPVLVSVLFIGGQAGAEPRISRFAYLWARHLQVCQPARTASVLPLVAPPQGQRHSPAGGESGATVVFPFPARFEG
jgi:hypothetical protein